MTGPFHEFNKIVQSTGGTKQVNNEYLFLTFGKKSVLTPDEINDIKDARDDYLNGQCKSLEEIKRNLNIG